MFVNMCKLGWPTFLLYTLTLLGIIVDYVVRGKINENSGMFVCLWAYLQWHLSSSAWISLMVLTFSNNLPKRWHDANIVKKVLSSVFSLISAIIRLKMDKGSQQMRKTVTKQIKSQLVLKCVNNYKRKNCIIPFHFKDIGFPLLISLHGGKGLESVS